MNRNINSVINNLVAYAMDKLLLDALDQTYAVNRLSSLCGITSPVVDPDADCGEASLDALLAELKALVPNVDVSAAAELLFPMPRTVNYYLDGKLARGTDKALDFLFTLYSNGYRCLSQSPAIGTDGFVGYYKDGITPIGAAALSVGDRQLVYTPLVLGNRIAALENPDLLIDDIVSRIVAFASEYKLSIAARIGDNAEYSTAANIALSKAAVKKQLSDGTVKIALLSYPVPALKLSGIAKNAVQREAVRILKAAASENLATVVAADGVGGPNVYIVFAKSIGSNEFIFGDDALAACGVYQTKNCSNLLSVLEKGTALSTDLAEFRPIYDKIGGVKHGKDALKALGGALVELFLPLLEDAASATDEQAERFAAVQ